MQPPRVALAATALLILLGCRSDESPSPGASTGPDPVEVAQAPEGLSDAEVVARAGSAVWRVATEGCSWLGSGSAFAIDAHHLVTNRHVIANDVTPELVSPTGERRSGRVIGAERDEDVAVIRVDDPLPVTLQWAPTESLQPAEHLVVLGYPAPALEFTATVGSIVNFQGRDGGREAMLTDAPINPGNSGGPGLRSDVTVAGVVTQMTLADPGERAAIIFTAASVRGVVERYIAEPQEVVSDCGQGPDYVPPLPDHFDVPVAPPAPATTATTAPLPVPTVPSTSMTVRSTTTRPAPTTSTSVPCPSFTPVAQIESFTTEPGAEEGTWEVTASGPVHNGSTAAIGIFEIVVTAQAGEPVTFSDIPDDPELEPGETTRFEASVTIVAEEAPTDPHADVVWAWMDPRFGACPTS